MRAHYLASERLDILVRRVIVAEHLRDSALLLLGQCAFARPHLPVPVCSHSPHATGVTQARKRRARIPYGHLSHAWLSCGVVEFGGGAAWRWGAPTCIQLQNRLAKLDRVGE